MLHESLNTYEIENHRIHLFLRDAGANMVAATGRMGIDSSDCLAHKINLVNKYE
jgi:hypothetical protein